MGLGKLVRSPLVYFAAGLSLVGCLAVGALVWPALSSYLHRPTGVDTISEPTFDRTPLHANLAEAGLRLGDEAFVRIFKREHRLELWLKPEGGERFALFRSYDICTWSGALGPKLKEGDHQSPEGFYRVSLKQLNPNSRHHLAFNLGFPNAYDLSLGRTGSFLMVHGGCSSVGCFAMTDQRIDEIYAVVEAALGRGQREVDVAIYPFEFSETALQAEAHSPWLGFWQNLKAGDDLFTREGAPPRVATRAGRYVFGDDATGPGCTPISGWV
jgi:murein L,D-transpeptidase YafK